MKYFHYRTSREVLEKRGWTKAFLSEDVFRDVVKRDPNLSPGQWLTDHVSTSKSRYWDEWVHSPVAGCMYYFEDAADATSFETEFLIPCQNEYGKTVDIEKLARQANTYAITQGDLPENRKLRIEYSLNGRCWIQEVFHKKFAELILKQCDNIVEHMSIESRMWNSNRPEFTEGWYTGAEASISELKKRFGVEE